MSKLDDIVDKIQPEYVADIPKAKQLIKGLFLEIIGDNEKLSNSFGGNYGNYTQRVLRNRFRNKLRKEVKEL